MKVYYRDEYVNELVCEVMTNHSMTVDEALDLCDVDMDKFAGDKGWEDWDPNALVAVYGEDDEEETKMKKVFIKTNAYNMVGYVFNDGMIAFDCETLGDALAIDDSGVVGCKSAEEAAVNCDAEVYPFDEDRYESVIVISENYEGDNDIPTRYVLGKTEIAISGTVEKIEGTAAEYNNWDLDEEIGVYDTYEEAKEQLKKYKTEVTKGPELTYITEYIILETARALM